MIYVIFHAKSIQPFRPCMDGLFAAAIAKQRHPEARLVPAMYGLENAPDLNIVEGDTVYLLDLTYPAHIIKGWAAKGAKVIVLDHHKTAMQDLAGLSSEILATFDMSRSGAMLAWNYFFDDFFGEVSPLIVRYVQDRDLWIKQMPDCDLINLGLQHLTRVFPGQPIEEHVEHCIDVAQYLMFGEGDTLDFVRRAGVKLQAQIDEAIGNAASRAKWRLVAGHNVPFVRATSEYEKLAYSDIAHALLKLHPSAPFACVETGGGWALRSDDDRLDVSTIAKSLGGGGHRNASGCRSGNPSAWR